MADHSNEAQVIDLDTWDQFEATLDGIRDRIEQNKETGISGLLFRGQSNANWTLDTTLERFSQEYNDTSLYCALMRRAMPEVQAYTTDHRWPEIDYEKYKEWTREFDPASLGNFPQCEFMVYLRHHEYPSPLLDWSRSPHIAAFFAFRPPQSHCDRCAIYVYCADTGHGHSGGSSGPNLITLPHYVATHRRHFMQQCEYTVCAIFPDAWYYTPHEKGFSERWRSEQDMLWKITLPTAEHGRKLITADDHARQTELPPSEGPREVSAPSFWDKA